MSDDAVMVNRLRGCVERREMPTWAEIEWAVERNSRFRDRITELEDRVDELEGRIVYADQQLAKATAAIRRHKDRIEVLQKLKPLQRIDALEAALRNIAECVVRPGTAAYELQQKARRALEGKTV